MDSALPLLRALSFSKILDLSVEKTALGSWFLHKDYVLVCQTQGKRGCSSLNHFYQI